MTETAEILSLEFQEMEVDGGLAVVVSGLPQELRGWNKEFVRCKRDPNTYVSAAYTFYPRFWFFGGISVNAARIRKSADGWIFEEFDDDRRWKRIGSKILKRNAMGIPELNSIENPQGEWNLEYDCVLKYGRVIVFEVADPKI